MATATVYETGIGVRFAVAPRPAGKTVGFAPGVDLTLSAEEAAFRDELRQWLAANNPGREPGGDGAAFAFRRDWQRRLNEAGYAGVSWPRAYGGRGGHRRGTRAGQLRGRATRSRPIL